jgi:hypothetical protein
VLSIRGFAAFLILVFLAGCGSAPPPSPPPQPAQIDPNAACLGELSAAHATFEPLAVFGEGNCAIANPVRLTGSAVPWNRPGVLSCPMARTLVRFEQDVVQPAARRHFGQPVRRIDHMGTYDCRRKRNDTEEAAARNGTSRGGRLSEHSKGQAIDLAGFLLADGTAVNVKRDWHGGGKAGAFLREVARASCRVFNVVLTPNHDRFHLDHIHLDVGPYTLCGV